jgi:hypothetical protein
VAAFALGSGKRFVDRADECREVAPCRCTVLIRSAGKVVTRDNKRITALAGLLDVTPTLEITAQPLRLEQALAVLVERNGRELPVSAELAAARISLPLNQRLHLKRDGERFSLDVETV